MAERPILFSAPMVRAILAGTKTQTRRAVKAAHPDWVRINPQPHQDDAGRLCYGWDGNVGKPLCCPYGQPGDRLWVRETWGFNPDFPGLLAHICFRADRGHEHDAINWRPSIHMPRAASRITLEVTGVRVERLQAISEADARAEGVAEAPLPMGLMYSTAAVMRTRYREGFGQLWCDINGANSWDANPWVWAVEFKRVTP